MLNEQIRWAIKKARYDSHRTLMDIAGNAGVSYSTLSQFLNGRVDIRVATLQKIFEDLKIDVKFCIQSRDRFNEHVGWDGDVSKLHWKVDERED